MEVGAGDSMLEIGAGFGELTFALAKRCEKVFAIESDRRIVSTLRHNFNIPSNMELITADFLSLDIAKYIGSRKVIIYGNLPYYITSPILAKIFFNISSVKKIYVTVQKEVAGRMVAAPGSKEIGRLSLYVQYYTEPKLLFKIEKGSFYPSPEIESAFLRLDVRKRPKVDVSDERILFQTIKRAYSQRRKNILNSLADGQIEKKELAMQIQQNNIDPNSRAEDLSLEDFAAISEIFSGS